MNGVSGIHTSSAADTAAIRKADMPQTNGIDKNKGNEPGLPERDNFRHQEPESPGKYWVSAGEDGPSVRFDKPTTKSAQLLDQLTETPEAKKLSWAEPGEAEPQTPEAPRSAPKPEVRRPERPSADGDEPKKADPDKDKTEPETTTCDTDAVDRELEQLRSKVQQLQQQTQTAKDAASAEEAKRELAEAERELSMKDNDAYRRSHARFY